jgi:hypothetical protein
MPAAVGNRFKFKTGEYLRKRWDVCGRWPSEPR